MRKIIHFLSVFIIVISLSSLFANASNVSISFINTEGENDDVTYYSGIKIVFVYLPTCPNCHLEIDEIKEVEERYNITIFGLSAKFNETNEQLLDYKKENNLSENWIMGYVTNKTVVDYKIRIVPFIIILDDYNYIVAIFEGFTYASTLEEKIKIAINHETEQYISDPLQDNSDLLKILFIIIGIGVSVLVIVFIVKPGLEILYYKIKDKKEKKS
ncbi:MAG: TlpA family protein disulfide reductase [Candidatus Heimdallarchaeaceae archaeon]